MTDKKNNVMCSLIFFLYITSYCDIITENKLKVRTVAS